MSEPKPDISAMEDQLEKVGEEIAEARHEADEADGHKPRETFVDQGRIGADKTDDAIVPPG
jgi:hypothetical protein